MVQWLWQTLESFPNEERMLFLRFVSGRSRLPLRISDIPQRFQLSVYDQVNSIMEFIYIEYLYVYSLAYHRN